MPALVRAGRLALLLLLLADSRAGAEPPDMREVVFVPEACAQFWVLPGGRDSPVAWDAALSFAAGIQGDAVYDVTHADQLDDLVAQLQGDLDPALAVYRTALERGSGRVQLRAAYFVGLGQVALMTRARASIASPALRAPLETLLARHAQLASIAFATVERGAAADETLAPDAPSQYMVRSARTLSALLAPR